MKGKRSSLLVVDGLGLLGVIIFSVLAALKPDNTAYIVAQIICAVLVLASTLLLRRLGGPLP